MGVPKEILRVPRPTNTVVVENKCDGPKKYAVRARAGIKYVRGKNPQPINGAVIGHIFNGKFVELGDNPGEEGPACRSYGSSILAKMQSTDYLDDLLKIMEIDYAVKTYVAALLKVVSPGVKAKRMSTEYRRTFVGHWYPNVEINSNSLTDLYRRIGMDQDVRRNFAIERLKHLKAENHLVIDGMLKEDNSIINDLSGYNHKSKTSGIKDLSIIYAYDLEEKTIVCSEVFPGGYIDAAAYERFIRDNDITKGIIVADKGFPPSMIREELDSRPDLHYLAPLKRNDSRIADNKMMEFTGVLKDTDDKVLYKKKSIGDNKFLYSFRDSKKASVEEANYLLNIRKKNKGFDYENYSKKRDDFGTIVFISDCDMEVEKAYECYSYRWLIELVFKFFKNDLDINTTNAQDDFTVIGEEFVNTIAAGITCRILKVFRDKEMLGELSFGDLMNDLSGLWRSVKAPEDVMPERKDRYWVHPLEYALDHMIKLGLCKGDLKYPDKKKGPIAQERRPRGRPRKNPIVEQKEKRPRGRPRKYPPVDPNAPKRPRGRPRKTPALA